MTIRSRRHRQRSMTSLVMTMATLSLLTAGCASLANTPAQELAWSRWTACHPQAPGTDIRMVRLDGRISFWYDGPADRRAILDCVRVAAKGGVTLPEPVSEPRECSGGVGGS